ncbi:hypothetical protein FRUB_03614 [Fimbriiglobus ruber]|uniref:Uncharacterized protein n=1 Tax=Fimbriiglobus ruber TaxID=1908690 RepID=A0A225E5S3_9BACT|nr:hypothetical protein FRUB_03614 [Fimbriiglobus ruber]
MSLGVVHRLGRTPVRVGQGGRPPVPVVVGDRRVPEGVDLEGQPAVLVVAVGRGVVVRVGLRERSPVGVVRVRGDGRGRRPVLAVVRRQGGVPFALTTAVTRSSASYCEVVTPAVVLFDRRILLQLYCLDLHRCHPNQPLPF